MDKTLMRPLFRQKAEEILRPKKIDGTKVPGYFGGALISTGIRLATPAFRYLAASRPVQAISRASQTPVGQGVMGAGEAGLVYSGAGDVAEGVKEGDYYRVLGGLSSIVPGMAYLPSSLRGTGIKALQGVKDIERLQPVKSGKGIVGSVGLGALGYTMAEPSTRDATEAQRNATKNAREDIQDRLIYSKPTYANDIVDETGLEQSTPMTKPRVIGIKNPKNVQEQQINQNLVASNKILDVANQLGINLDVDNLKNITDKQLKQISIESNINLNDVYRLTGRSPTPAPKNPIQATNEVTSQIPGMTNTEIGLLANNRKKELEEAKRTSSMSEEFQAFKKQLSSVTGEDNDNLLNLVAMKAAGKLLSGKTKEKGTRGFLDVGGQALEGAASDMLQLALAQKSQDMELAKAFLKMKTDQSQGPGFLEGDKVFRIEDKNFPGNFYNVKGLRGKDGRNYILDPKTNNVRLATEGEVGNIYPEDPKAIAYNANQLEENKRGTEMIETVINALPENGTFAAAFGLAKEDVFGTIENVAGKRYDFSSPVGGSFDAKIKALMRNNKDEKEQEALLKKYDNDMDKVEGRALEMYKEATGKSTFFGRPTDKELETFTKLALIEQRMKYIVANANKSEDRLTQKDIENAEKRTKIIQFYGSAKAVRQNYINLKEEFEKKAESFAMQYRQAGGTESSMLYYRNKVPGVAKMYERKARETLEDKAKENKQQRTNILSTIPIFGAK